MLTLQLTLMSILVLLKLSDDIPNHWFVQEPYTVHIFYCGVIWGILYHEDARDYLDMKDYDRLIIVTWITFKDCYV